MSYKQGIVNAIQALSSSPGRLLSSPVSAVQIRTHLQNSPHLVSTFENATFLKCLVDGIESGALIQSGGGYRLAEGWEDMDWRDETPERTGDSGGMGDGRSDSATASCLANGGAASGNVGSKKLSEGPVTGNSEVNRALTVGQTVQARPLRSVPGQGLAHAVGLASAQTFQQQLQQQRMAQNYSSSPNSMFMGMPAVRAPPPTSSHQQVAKTSFIQLDERYANLNNQTVMEQAFQHHVARQSMGRWPNGQGVASQPQASSGNNSHSATVSSIPPSSMNAAQLRNNGASNFNSSSSAPNAGNQRLPMIQQYMDNVVNVEDESERQRIMHLAVELDADLNKIMEGDHSGESASRGNTGSVSGAKRIIQSTGRNNATPDVINIDDNDEKMSKSPSSQQAAVGKRPAAQSLGTDAKKAKLHSTLPPGTRAMNQQGTNVQLPLMKDQDSSWLDVVVTASQDEKRKKKDSVSAIVEEDIFGLAGTFIKGMLNVDHDILNQAFQGATIQKCISNTIAPGLGLPHHLLQNMNPGAWEGYVHVSSDLIIRFAREIITQMTKGVRSALKVACKEMTENHIRIMGRCRKEREEKARLSNSSAELKAAKDEESAAQLSQRVKDLEKQLAEEKRKRSDQIAEMEKSQNEYLEEYEKQHSHFVLKMSQLHEETVETLKKEIEDMKHVHNEIIETYLDASVETVKAILGSERSRV